MALNTVIWRNWLGRVLPAASLLLVLTGCQAVHEVTIDAISNSSKPMGSSYHLVVHDPSGGVDTDLQAQVTNTIHGALAARGLYRAPPSVRPDMVINLTYGVGQGHIKILNTHNTDLLLGGGIMPSNKSKAVVVFDKFIELSAREPEPDPATLTGPAPGGQPTDELWNIRARIEDPKNVLAPFVDVITAASLEYIGENTGQEVHRPLRSDQAKLLLNKPAAPDVK